MYCEGSAGWQHGIWTSGGCLVWSWTTRGFFKPARHPFTTITRLRFSGSYLRGQIHHNRVEARLYTISEIFICVCTTRACSRGTTRYHTNCFHCAPTGEIGSLSSFLSALGESEALYNRFSSQTSHHHRQFEFIHRVARDTFFSFRSGSTGRAVLLGTRG